MPGVECCKFEAVEGLNDRLKDSLQSLLRTPFFRYYQVALDKPCPYWRDNGFCTQKSCSVRIMEKKPNSWDSAPISDVSYPQHELDPLMVKRWVDYDEFCLMDRECDQGVFVDLVENPERFTGYSGEPANKIWSSIYEENCFTNVEVNNPLANSDWNKCEEKQMFYRIISGLHASISTHLAYDWFNQKTNVWEPNFEIFHDRVGNHIERLGNMYFDYMLIYRAITKLNRYLRSLEFDPTEDAGEEGFIQNCIKNITRISPECPKNFDRILFASNSKPHIVDEMRKRFRNITSIMDCVSCERCRLWGKVQTMGIGTALKILFASDKKAKWARTTFRRCEIVALFNVFGRFSESIEAVQRFRAEYKQRLEHQEHFRTSFYSASNAVLLITIVASSVLVYVGLGNRKQRGAVPLVRKR